MSRESPITITKNSADRRKLRAQYLLEGKSWRQANLQAGFSMSVANKGPRNYIHGHPNEKRTRSVLRPGIAKDFERAAAETIYKPDFVKKAITHRLMSSIIQGQSSDCAREAELVGRMKEFDLFVNPSTGTSIGIFAVLADPDSGALLEENLAAMKDYRDGSDFTCAWCSEECNSAESLQLHALSCAKRPIAVRAITSTATGEARQ